VDGCKPLNCGAASRGQVLYEMTVVVTTLNIKVGRCRLTL